MSDWQKFTLQIPGKDYLEKVRGVLETLLVYLEVLKAILETIKAFLIDFGNPIKALVEALIKLIQQMFEALKQTGLYGYFDVPEPNFDPNFDRNAGGSQAFVNRFKASLFDDKDPNRPQPLPFFNQAGFIILMVDASSVMRMIRLIMVLLRFFGKEFTAPRYAAPANARVLPVGDKGDPILAVAKIFSTDITAVAVEWSLPTAQMTPDPGFQDVVANTAAEFIPPCFLVEKSEIDPMSAEIDIGTAASEPDSVGIVTHQRETGFESGGKLVKRKERVRDMYGDIVVKFQRYYMVSPTQTPETFWTGQLGKFRWIDSEVEKDKTYYYRVRAFSGSLFWDKNQHILFFPATLSYTPTNPSGFTWPADDSSDPPVMGKPTGIFSVRIPKIPANFDVLENLKRLFQTAFSLDFHLAPIIKKTGPDTNPTVVRPVFNDNGDPVYPTLPEDIGRGSLENWAGPLATFDALPLVGIVSSATTMSEQYKPSDVTGRYPDMPWQKFIVRYNSTRMANLVASAMLQAGSYAIEGFREIMQGPLPMGPVVFGVMSGKTTLEQCVFALTDIIPDDPEHPSRGSSIDLPQASTYGSVYSDETFRKNVLVAINQIKNFTLGGVKPDWQSLALLRDIVPWAGQILYQILAAIQSLLDAFNGVIQEIKDFIDLLLRKINALERFIEFLIRLMEYVLSLDVSCYVLNVSPITNGIPELIEAIDNAGNAPPMDPGGYSAGIALAYVAPDISAFQKAFGLIF
jgi:hypothetical protein